MYNPELALGNDRSNDAQLGYDERKQRISRCKRTMQEVMSLESLKWWHWTLITLVVVLGFKFAQLEMTGEAPPKTPMERPALSGLIPVTAATAPTVSGEYDRITIEAHLAAARPAALVDATAALVRQVAEGLQHGVREDSPAVTLVRVLVETEGLDRLGKTSRNLSL